MSNSQENSYVLGNIKFLIGVEILFHSIIMEQERKTFIRSEAITMSCMIVIPENHSTMDENDYVIMKGRNYYSLGNLKWNAHVSCL